MCIIMQAYLCSTHTHTHTHAHMHRCLYFPDQHTNKHMYTRYILLYNSTSVLKHTSEIFYTSHFYTCCVAGQCRVLCLGFLSVLSVLFIFFNLASKIKLYLFNLVYLLLNTVMFQKVYFFKWDIKYVEIVKNFDIDKSWVCSSPCLLNNQTI